MQNKDYKRGFGLQLLLVNQLQSFVLETAADRRSDCIHSFGGTWSLVDMDF